MCSVVREITVLQLMLNVYDTNDGTDRRWGKELGGEPRTQVVQASDQDATWALPLEVFWAHPTGRRTQTQDHYETTCVLYVIVL